MYIEEIIVEGFKSYATRTVISGWDPEFNAITGLNGSGKSNILDAICFVLGIDNLRQVRAASLQDLVYKRGQSGITKASVSLVFNNDDAQKSPPGYSDCSQITVTRQIILGGKNKYLINGHSVQQKQVDTLFHSVQLNVNNPHFLIMQGQITKVLNMRPMEILAMVEESAGTRMFEDRKEKALSTLDKKEAKVNEINALLAELIDPKLVQLRSQRSDFIEYKRAEAELERSKKIIVAADFAELRNKHNSAHSFVQQAKEQIENLHVQEASYKQELQVVEKKLDQLTKKRMKESKNANQIKDLEEQIATSEREKTRIATQLTLLQQNQVDEMNKLAELTDSEGQLKKQLTVLHQQFELEESKFKQINSQLDSSRKQLMKEEELLQSITDAGVEGTLGVYNRLISELKDQDVKLCVEMESLKQRISNLETELQNTTPKLKGAQKDCSGMVESIEHLSNQIHQLQSQLDSLPAVDPANERSVLMRERKRIEGDLAEANEVVQSLYSEVAHALKFDHHCTGLDANKVKGVVAGLVELPESHSKYSTALEVAAGGRLYNVVVDDDATAKQLLDKGRLTRRVTIIPLNKIVAKSIPNEKIKAADRSTNGRAKLALSLIGYSECVEDAMRFVFGSTFICEDQEAANRVTFDKAIAIRSVTIAGDVYEPSGTLTGGSMSHSSGGILEKISLYNNQVAAERDLQLQLDMILDQLNTFDNDRMARSELEGLMELKQHELSLMQQQLEQNASGKLIAHIRSLEAEMAGCKTRLDNIVKLKSTNDKEIERMQEEQGDMGQNKQSKVKSLEKRVAFLKKSLQKTESEYKLASQEMELASAQLANTNNNLKELQTSIKGCRLMIDESEGSMSSLAESLEQLKSSLRELTRKLEAEQGHLRLYDSEITSCEERRSFLYDALERTVMEGKQLSINLTRTEETINQTSKELSTIAKQHPWIADQEHLFGQPDGPFDWSKAEDLDEMRRKVKALEGQHCAQRKNININVMDMIDRVEAKETSLKQMLATVKKDKVKIEDTIGKLEDYKLETLEKTWKQVNEYLNTVLLTNSRDFGAIFEGLLPGSFARLDRPEGAQSITTAGLEIKVRLGAVWKESLSELSGGQKSLIALSLILALLRHKPAPVYILDEVDAALDPSHTQNIGRILRSSRFHGAQFIVVSLKEGMFGNANVLFKTRFRDGVSGVERMVNESPSSQHQQQQQQQQQLANKKTTTRKIKMANSQTTRLAVK